MQMPLNISDKKAVQHNRKTLLTTNATSIPNTNQNYTKKSLNNWSKAVSL